MFLRLDVLFYDMELKKSMDSKMKILVTGGSGFVGRNLTENLVKNGHEVIITSTGNEPTISGVKKVLYMGLNGIDQNYLSSLDAVIHLMANNDTLCTDREEMFRLNVDGPKDLFNKAFEKGCRRFIYASSTAVYGNEPAPYIEDKTPINPLNVYGESKAAFDEFAMGFAKKNSVMVYGFRYCNIFGPGEDQKGRRMSLIGQILRQVKNNQKVKLFEFGEQKRDWVYVKDVVQANLRALDRFEPGKGLVLNIGSGKSYSFNELIKIVSEVTWKRINPEYIPCTFKDSYQNHTECDINKAKKELGYHPEFSLRSGIEEYYKSLTS